MNRAQDWINFLWFAFSVCLFLTGWEASRQDVANRGGVVHRDGVIIYVETP